MERAIRWIVVAALAVGGCAAEVGPQPIASVGQALTCTPGTAVRGVPQRGALDTSSTILTQRFYEFRLPTGFTLSGTHPLILVLHGGNFSAGQMRSIPAMTDLIAQAEARNAVLVWPQGHPDSGALPAGLPATCGALNTGAGAVATTYAATWDGMIPSFRDNDDALFLLELIDFIDGPFRIDRTQVYAVGHSKGAEMVHRMGGEAAGTFAAIAGVASVGGGVEDFDDTMTTGPSEVCGGVARFHGDTRVQDYPDLPMPVLLAHSIDDSFAPFDGGVFGSAGDDCRFGVDEIFENWRVRNRCQSDARVDFGINTYGWPGFVRYTQQRCSEYVPLNVNVMEKITYDNLDPRTNEHYWPSLAVDGYDLSADIVSFFMQFPINKHPSAWALCRWKGNGAGPGEGFTFSRPPPGGAPLNPLQICGGRAATMIGTNGDDLIIGTTGVDVIVGGGGDDAIFGLGGDDIICAGSGRDYVEGNHGEDTIFGSDGGDCIKGDRYFERTWDLPGPDDISGGDISDFIEGEDGGDSIDGDRGHDVLFGGDGADVIRGGVGDDDIGGNDGGDWLFGGDGRDVIAGHDGVNWMFGERHGDRIIGGPDIDAIAGGPGPDDIFGNGGEDILSGNEGRDYIEGGDDNDTINCGAGTDEALGQGGFDSTDGACETFTQ